jgi:hypothetical protein
MARAIKRHPERGGGREHQVRDAKPERAGEQHFLAPDAVGELSEQRAEHQLHQGERRGEHAQFERFCAQRQRVERQQGQYDAKPHRGEEQREQHGADARNREDLLQ